LPPAFYQKYTGIATILSVISYTYEQKPMTLHLGVKFKPKSLLQEKNNLFSAPGGAKIFSSTSQTLLPQAFAISANGSL
jgi:hypothetical protein